MDRSMRCARGVVALVLCLAVGACGAGRQQDTDVGSLGSVSAEGRMGDPVSLPELPGGVSRVKGLDAGREAVANRDLRRQLPEVPGARLVTVTDSYVLEEDEDEHSIATGLMTTWSYEIEGRSKCELADTFEAPMEAAGWQRTSMETMGATPPSLERFSYFFRSPARATVTMDGGSRRFWVEVQARSAARKRVVQPTGDDSSALFVTCRPDPPPPPPHPPADHDAALAENERIFRSLPLPAGAVVTEHFPESATAMGASGGAIGYGSAWRLTPPADKDFCALARDFDTAMAAAGWERFTEQSFGMRDSHFYDPPRSVEFAITTGGIVHVLVMGNGAQVGTRQYPGHPATFTPGATPESRGKPVPCLLDNPNAS